MIRHFIQLHLVTKNKYFHIKNHTIVSVELDSPVVFTLPLSASLVFIVIMFT